MNEILFYLALVVYILACIIMIVAILLSESKGGGLATAFGGGGQESAFGASIGRKINRFTAGAVVVFLVLSIGLGLLWAKVGTGTANIKPRAVPAAGDGVSSGGPDEGTSENDSEKPK